MKKRSIALASLLTTAVLLSATLASGILVHASPQTAIKKETVRIAALSYRAQGVGHHTGYPPMVVPFEFNPEDIFLNVTKVWVAIVANESWVYQPPLINVRLNDQLIHSQQYSESIALILIPVENPSVLQTITQGINTLSIRAAAVDGGGWAYVYEANVFIEYEYSTRK